MSTVNNSGPMTSTLDLDALANPAAVLWKPTA